MSIDKHIESDLANIQSRDAQKWFNKFIQQDAYVGELFSINYESAKVQIHDNERQQVGGIPSLSFLIATRIKPGDEIDFTDEDASFILLRVMDAAQLPNSAEAERIRVETAQRVSGEINKHWDSENIMDTKTRVYLGYAGVECRIIGTFFLDISDEEGDGALVTTFGSDISNFYPNRGLKVYKPHGEALESIVNHTAQSNLQENIERYGTAGKVKVRLGCIRYASTNRKFQGIDVVPVSIYSTDLLSQKTALFGMTRTGKSNTTKIIAKSVYELRNQQSETESPLRVGQIIFDPNGEYANENVQDVDKNENPSALKNVWRNSGDACKENEVVTYGITNHPNDPGRELMKLNFYKDSNLQSGKEIIDSLLVDDGTAHIKNFKQVVFDAPDDSDRSAVTRYKRRVLAYRAVLCRAGFLVPHGTNTSVKNLFGKDLRESLRESGGVDPVSYAKAADIFENSESLSLQEVGIAFEILEKFIRDSKSAYKNFENAYVSRPKGSGEPWADEDLKKIIGLFQYPNAVRKIGSARPQHSETTDEDYSDAIYAHLKCGKLVIVDQSTGSPELNKSSATRIMQKIFQENQRFFIDGKDNIPEILVYIEEAHNVLPAGGDSDLRDIWVRTAKEGAKYRIGMVYATQEVSSIQKNILRNTANWFIAHLNNTDETKELCKYYDFADFELSIRRAQDKGFLRIKTMSNPFVVPVQVDKFKLEV